MSFKPILPVAFLMVLCLLEFTFCKSIGDVFEKQDIDEAMESTSAEAKNPIHQHPSKRQEKVSQGIRNNCYSGSLEDTAKALGVLNLPGVRLVRVEGELYQKLLKNETVVERNKFGSNESASNASRESSPVKRSSESIDMCEEEYAYTYILAHANGQLAYQVDTVVCQGEYCRSPYLNYLVGEFGDCVLRKQTMVVYIINAYGNFVPQTIEIGCACECMAYY